MAFFSFVQRAHVEDLVKECHAENWHIHVIKHYRSRYHVYTACQWITEITEPTASVFEPGCGSGINLLWLGVREFRHLMGSDISEEALTLSRRLSKHFAIDVSVWKDNCLFPTKSLENIDVILSVNWLYHTKEGSLTHFLQTYKESLKRKGKIVLDVVDKSFNACKGNEFHTSDIKLPLCQRRPSEYKFRTSMKEVVALAERHGFTVLRKTLIKDLPPRSVYVLEKM